MLPRREQGFSLVELLVTLTILVTILAGLAGMLVQNARVNKSVRLAAEVQTSARSCVSLIVQKLRSAGWDPKLAGIPVVALDTIPGDGISEIEVFSDINADGATTGADEQVRIRHTGSIVEWRRSAAGSYSTLAVDVSNDANGDGVVEPMFTPIPNVNPNRIRVQVTATSPVPDPVTKQPIRFTVRSDVLLRKTL